MRWYLSHFTPKKKKNANATLVRFVDMKNSEKEKRVLSWCVGEKISKSCLNSGENITRDAIDPTEISSQLYSEFVNIESCCSKSDVLNDDMISCDHCLLNFHHSCTKVKKTTKKRHQWFCNACKIDFKSSEQTEKENWLAHCKIVTFPLMY